MPRTTSSRTHSIALWTRLPRLAGRVSLLADWTRRLGETTAEAVPDRHPPTRRHAAADRRQRASMEELEQVRAVHPRLARHMGPPCVLRHGRVTPTCTEGEHFCGVPVWRSFPDVTRRL